MIVIKYVEKETTAFVMNNELFYFRQGPGIPQIFDSKLKPQIIPNIDNWFQAKTQQQHSYKNFCDMAYAFAAGLQHNYTSDDLKWISKEMVNTTIKSIFQTDYAREFSTAYWIEMMNPSKLLKLIEHIRSDFDKFAKRYEPEELYNILCRLWQFSNFHAQSEAAVFETMIRVRLRRVPQIPQYPDTPDADQEIEKLVLKNLLGKTFNKFKGIPDKLVENVRRIQSR